MAGLAVKSVAEDTEEPEPILMVPPVSFVDDAPLPRKVTLLFMFILPPRAKVPAGISTYVLAGAEEMAAFMVAAVTFPPLTVLHCDVVHCVRVGGVHGLGVVSPSGKLAGSPALLQSIARLFARMPDHACPYESAGNNSNIEIRGNRCEQSRLIYFLASDLLHAWYRYATRSARHEGTLASDRPAAKR